MADKFSSSDTALLDAAATLTGSRPRAVKLLRSLGYVDGDEAAPLRAKMLRAAGLFRRLFRLPVPDAPGLLFFGAEADPTDLGLLASNAAVGGFAGSGLDQRRAFEACVGEGIEYLSQFAQQTDTLQSAAIGRFCETLDPASFGFVAAVMSACAVPADQFVDCISVRRISDDSACWYPADLCLRRSTPDFAPPLKLSTGCAAGVTQDAATLHAMLELIERDAVALWWRGGRRGRAIDNEVAATLLAKLRQTQTDRNTSLLDITTDLGIPVVAAFSTPDEGRGFAIGFGAGTTLSDAARSAIFEMCQSELSLHVIAAKRRQSGDAALNESDRIQLARAEVDTQACPLLHPRNDDSPRTVFAAEAIAQQLADHAIVVYSLDLTRPQFGVPVVRVIAPGLQLEPCSIIGERLARAIAETGGGARHTGGIALL